MQSKDIRQTFLEFFESKNHKRLPSSSLIPADHSVLLTIAGMLQFKPIFLGLQKSDFPRVTTCQKCVRVNDLERVGHTSRHHTFFEMLGNFSFGDYFKTEAIQFAWELLTQKYKLPAEKLKIAVFADDEETFAIWKNEIGLSEDRIFRLDEENNFWAAASTGPCGPCSEIYYDFGEDKSCGKDCKPGCDCDRFLEVWNLVFIEFDRDPDGELNPLPKKNIDTGMGLERIARILQGVPTNFETDLFVPIIKRIGEVSTKDNPISKKIIADHSRAITYLIADGVTPLNQERGFVLRRLIRRAIMHGKKLGFTDFYLWDFCDMVIDLGKDFYPELKAQRNFIKSIVQSEEKSFDAVFKNGLEILEKIISSARGKHLSGAEIFKLHDTHGFPYDLTKEILEDRGYTFDETGFHKKMEEQREMARAAQSKDDFLKIKQKALENYGPTEFIGYDEIKTKAKVIGVMPEEGYIILDKTPFYPEGGGQVGDIGTIAGEKVLNTIGEIGGVIFHKMEHADDFNAGEEVQAEIDFIRRSRITVHHTSTHLLQSALRLVLGETVKQAGSYVGPDRLRFDFTSPQALTEKQIKKVEALVNQNIISKIDMEVSITDYEEAQKKGAIALFDQKYGKEVRMIEVRDVSRELCGGCHVKNTRDIEIFKILKEEALQAGVRRIEAVAGQAAWFYFKERLNAAIAKIRELSTKLGQYEEPVRPEVELQRFIAANSLSMIDDLFSDLDKQVESLIQRIKNKEKAMEEKLTNEARALKEEAIENVREIKGVKVLTYQTAGLDIKSLRVLSDTINDTFASGIVLLASQFGGRVYFLAMVSADLIEKGYNAGELVRVMAQTAGGMGGGKPDRAEAGAKDPSRIEAAFNRVLEIL